MSRVLRSVFQIVPRPPGQQDGVGDYARILAGYLKTRYGLETIFLSAARSADPVGGSRVHSPLRSLPGGLQLGETDAMVLHYVNYGYDRRGIPMWLAPTLEEIKGTTRLLTIFHELYATGSIRRSAFWLQPIQKRIVRAIARISDAALVSNSYSRGQLERLAPDLRIVAHPVISNFGEPTFSKAEIGNRDPQCWIICGGTELVQRSLASFQRVMAEVAAENSPKTLFVLGGRDNPWVRTALKEQRRVTSHYYPNISAEHASQILSQCAFGWIDYFVRPKEPPELILKSSAFAACCAHAVIPVTPQLSGAIDQFPGMCFVGSDSQRLPGKAERSRLAEAIYQWYQTRASSACLAAAIYELLTDR